MERRVSTRFERYWTESGREDGQGDVEKKDHQLYRRPYMMGKAKGKEELKCSCTDSPGRDASPSQVPSQSRYSFAAEYTEANRGK